MGEGWEACLVEGSSEQLLVEGEDVGTGGNEEQSIPVENMRNDVERIVGATRYSLCS